MNTNNNQTEYLHANAAVEKDLIDASLNEEWPTEGEPIEGEDYFCNTEEEPKLYFFSACCQKAAIQQDNIYICSECAEPLDPELDLIDESDEDRFIENDYSDFIGRIMSDIEDFN